MAKLSLRMPYGQDGLWRTIRELRTFTLPELTARVSADPRTIRDYLRRLALAGFVRCTPPAPPACTPPAPPARTPAEPPTWELAVDQPETPRLRADGSPAAETGRGQDNMWRAMKMLDRFDAAELAAAASTDTVRVKLTTARAYIQALAATGYLHLEVPARPGGRGRRGVLAVWSLLPSMNTGPLAPQLQRADFVFDPNTLRAAPYGVGRSPHLESAGEAGGREAQP